MTEVLVTGGAYPSLFCAIMSNVGVGDEVSNFQNTFITKLKILEFAVYKIVH